MNNDTDEQLTQTPTAQTFASQPTPEVLPGIDTNNVPTANGSIDGFTSGSFNQPFTPARTPDVSSPSPATTVTTAPEARPFDQLVTNPAPIAAAPQVSPNYVNPTAVQKRTPVWVWVVIAIVLIIATILGAAVAFLV